MSEHEIQKDQFDKWQKQWDDALNQDVFKDLPQSQEVQGEIDFFGFGNLSKESESKAKDADSKYWNQVYALSMSQSPSGLAGQSELFTEEETEKVGSITTSEKQLEYPPNPVTVDSGGKDQDLSPESMGLTFDEKDIQDLADMKLKLHTLEDKLAANPNTKSNLTSQVTSLKEKIDELSSLMTNSYPTEITKKVQKLS